MKVALVGGHLAPTLAIIDSFNKADTIYIGRKTTFEGEDAVSLEYKTIKKLGIPFYGITTGRIQRTFSIYSVVSFLKIPFGLFQSLRILKKENPDIVLSFGGYVSVPVCLAAFFLRIPFVIHEQTLDAGLANRFLSVFANNICISWKQSEKYFPRKKVILTGNPLRKFPSGIFEKPHTRKPFIYITGGSTGSHAINALIESCLEKLLQEAVLLHQVGDSREFQDYERLTERKKDLPLSFRNNYMIEKFIPPEKIGSILKQADLVISRSGINTVTEIIAIGVPSLLIPLPHGQRNEQLRNAQLVKKLGLGDYILQEEVTPEVLFKKVTMMLENATQYRVSSYEAKNIVYANAAERIISVLYDTVQKKETKRA